MAKKKRGKVAGIGALDRKIKAARGTLTKLTAEERTKKAAVKKAKTLNGLLSKIAAKKRKK